MKFIDFEKLAALFLKYWDKFLIDGVSYTLALAAITVAFGAVFASVLALMKMSKIPPLRWLSTIYIEIIRGTPMMVQLLIMSMVIFANSRNFTMVGALALGAALGTMVANLSSHKAGWDARWEEFSDWADKGQKLMTELLHLVDEDTEAFNRIMNVFSMPKGTDEEKAARSAALQEATLYATQVPLRTMQTSFKVFEIVKAMAEQGNPNSVTDAGVGALAARSAVLGACLNVKINAAGLKDRAVADDLIGQANRIVADAEKAEREILEIVESKIK